MSVFVPLMYCYNKIVRHLAAVLAAVEPVPSTEMLVGVVSGSVADPARPEVDDRDLDIAESQGVIIAVLGCKSNKSIT